MNFSTEQSEITAFTEELRLFSSLHDLFIENRVTEDLFLSELKKLETHDLSKENLFNQMQAYFCLATSYNALKLRHLDFTKAYYGNDYEDKEVCYFRNVLYIVSKVKREQWASLYYSAFKTSRRSYMYLANAYDHLGRFNEALQYYDIAAEDEANLKEVEINKGYCYANMHAFWPESEPFVVRRAQKYLAKYAKEFDAHQPGLREKACSWIAPSFPDPDNDFLDDDDGRFQLWLSNNHLWLNRYADIRCHSIMAQGHNLKLHWICDSTERTNLFDSSFDEMRTQYSESIHLIYNALYGSKDVSVYQLKIGFKELYSILDKIALFLAKYLNIQVPVHKIDFDKVWYEKNASIRSEIMQHDSNLSLLALYNIHRDIYGSKIEGYVPDEQSKDLRMIRNYLEHRFVFIEDVDMRFDDNQLHISKDELVVHTIKISQLVRCALIYLCNFVMHAEYDKTHI